MREKTTHEYYERHNTQQLREEKKFVFVACEGARTEPKYLSHLCSAKKRSYVRFLESPFSNPLQIMELVLETLENKRMDYTPFSIANAILNTTKIDEESGKKILSFSQRIASKYGLKDTDIVSDELMPTFFNTLIGKLGKDISAKITIEKIKQDHMIDTLFDEVYLVSDRDASSYTDEQCKEVIRLCEENNIHYVLTNPCIEFFFLLHWTNCSQYNRSILKANRKIGKRTFVHFELCKYDPNYGKKSFKCDTYYGRYNVAKNNSLNFASSLDKLINDVGSNFFELVDLIIERDE